VSGHAEAAYAPVLGSLTPGSATVVVLMGLANRTAIARALLDAGWSGQTPAAVLIGVSQSGEDSWHGVLDGLQSHVVDDEGNHPGIIVVGAVAALAGIIAARDEEPDALPTTASLG